MLLRVRHVIGLVGLALSGLFVVQAEDAAFTPASEAQRPNILILYADDLGYGDVGATHPASKIPTPRLDQLAAQGLQLDDAHSSSGICTPSRFALLTGRRHWRNFHGIAGSMGRSFIPRELVTLPEFLRESGYATACIGKWHLGMGWLQLRVEGAEGGPHGWHWDRPIPDGPLAHGFDTYFGDDVINFPPYAWIEDDRVVQVPDTMLDVTTFPKIKEGSWECRPGPMVTGWNPYEVLPTLTERGVAYLRGRANQAEPFFLYFAFPSPHAPIIPNDAFDGRSEAGAYGDFVHQTDHCVGQLLDALEQAGLADNTLVIFSADNGSEHYAYPRFKKFGHWSSEPFRGVKVDVYEGGHHVPTFVRWPGQIAAGNRSDALTCQTDFFATIAAALDRPLAEEVALDSINQLAVWRNPARAEAPRTRMVHNTWDKVWAYRRDVWLLVDAAHGHHRKVNRAVEEARGYPPEDELPVELYDLSEDPGQRNNLAADHPELVEQLREELAAIRASERTR